MLAGTGSVGLALIYWVIGLVISLAGISVYLELLSFFPSRSGAEVVYLEQAFPRPKHFFPVAFAAQTIILSFISSNAIVLAGYIFKLADHTPSAWQLKGLAIGGLTVIASIVLINTKLSLRLVTILGFVKLGTLLFIIITGFVVLGGGAKKKVADPHANFRNAFEGTSSDGYYLSNALVSIIFSYGGFNNSVSTPQETQSLTLTSALPSSTSPTRSKTPSRRSSTRPTRPSSSSASSTSSPTLPTLRRYPRPRSSRRVRPPPRSSSAPCLASAPPRA